MRILQIVTLVSPDGAYGGPVRVAENQAKELVRRGHHVTVMAGRRGQVDGGIFGEGVESKLFPAIQLIPKIGFAGLVSPLMLVSLLRQVRKADVVHVHLARDLVTLPAALTAVLFRIPLVVQTHGMIDESSKVLARILDHLVTRRVILGAKRVFWLTQEEETSLRAVVGCSGFDMERLHNGVPETQAQKAGAQDEKHVRVLYLARLQARKRPLELAQSAVNLRRKNVLDFSVSFVGPDEGEASSLQDFISDNQANDFIGWEGPLPPSETQERLASADVFVLPSVNEPFPMSVLEAMSSGRPVIITDTCGLAPFVRRAGAGIVVDSSQGQLDEALQSLVSDDELRSRMGEAARQLAVNNFSMKSVGEQLEVCYAAVAGRDPADPATTLG